MASEIEIDPATLRGVAAQIGGSVRGFEEAQRACQVGGREAAHALEHRQEVRDHVGFAVKQQDLARQARDTGEVVAAVWQVYADCCAGLAEVSTQAADVFETQDRQAARALSDGGRP